MTRSISIGILGSAVIAAVLTAAPPQVVNHKRIELGYTIRALPIPAGFNYADAVDINSSGEAAGAVGGPSGTQPLLNVAGANILLESLGGLYNHATAINESGQVAGASESQPWWGFKAVRWDVDGSMTVIMPITGDEHDNCYAHAINSNGDIAGQSDTPGGMARAFFWSAETGTIDLGTLGGSYSSANDVNDKGVVVGWSGSSSFFSTAFVWRDGVVSPLSTLEESELPGGIAHSINNQDVIAGDVNGEQYGVTHAAMWDAEGELHLLGSLGGLTSHAFDINDAGTIVGESDTADDEIHAFIYRNGTMRDLNSLLPPNSGWVLFSASSISNDGRIAGYGTFNGQVRSFVMEPKQPVVLQTID